MEFRELQEALEKLSSKELAEILTLFGDWLPVARQVVSIKAGFVAKINQPDELKEIISNNLTIDEYVKYDRCGPFFLIVSEIHDQLKKLKDQGKEELAKELALLTINTAQASEEMLEEPDSWTDAVEELEKWLNSL